MILAMVNVWECKKIVDCMLTGAYIDFSFNFNYIGIFTFSAIDSF